MKFLIQMAWRDARRQRRRLMLCSLSIVFGVAALVAVDSFAHNLRVAIDSQAMELLGADLRLSSRTPFSERAEAWIDKTGGQQSREVRFNSMAYFPEVGQSRLVQVRALEGDFPYYGEFKTRPAGRSPARSGEAVAVLDPLLMTQYGLSSGDTVRIGQTEFTITAEIVQVPGESAFAGIFAPRVYIPLSELEATGLIGLGSIAFYRVYFQLPEGLDEAALADAREGLFAEERLRVETVETRKEALGDALENLARYLGLVGFVALLLGGVGIAGSVQVYLKDKQATVAILRCLGASSRQAFAVYLLQMVMVALAGALPGALLGVSVQALLPRVLAPILPFEMDYFVSWPSIATGLLFGVLVAFVFTLFPLLPIRRVSPLQAIRASVEQARRKPDPLVWPLGALALALLVGFCVLQTPAWWQGLVFAAGLGLALLCLWGAGGLLVLMLKKFARPRHYLWRQGLLNLHRPNNRTVFIVVSLGLGAFLIYTLQLVEEGLLAQTKLADTQEEPNMLFFDIQVDQREGLYALIEAEGLEVMDEAPVVTMRLQKVDGRTVTEIKGDPGRKIDDWILNREWRSTWRGEPGQAEAVVAGEYVGKWNGLQEPIPISLEADMAADLGIGLGSTLTFDIQGIPLQVEISSLRTVDWTSMRPNFFATFPAGVLEEAPAWWIAVTRSPDVETTAALQRRIFEKYPNISAIDLRIILEALQDILARINFAIRFMALFTVATGILVLASAIITSRYQRVQESVLLRTLGASARQIRAIMAIEYALLGLLAGVVGVALAIIAGAALTHWVFKMELAIPWGGSLAAIAIVTLLTVITGLLNSRGIASHPPLAVLREEG